MADLILHPSRGCTALLALRAPVAPRRASLLGQHPWLTAASFVLLAYALLGKGGGYIGIPPLFIGELLLLGGVAALFAFGHFPFPAMPRLLGCVLAFGAWGLLRTIPFISTYGLDALRDAVIWGYAAFAFVWFFYILSDTSRL